MLRKGRKLQKGRGEKRELRSADSTARGNGPQELKLIFQFCSSSKSKGITIEASKREKENGEEAQENLLRIKQKECEESYP